MDKDKLYQLKNEATKIKPIINIGKNGITDSVVEEIKKQVKANRLVKIKMLKTSAEGEDIKTSAEKLAEATKTTLIDVRGSTVVIYR
ncbi:RNA-binding protein [Methanolobus vulcani]|jgi:RNA-binding protein|uniref:RNA-binding protein n=1 Tax=Methanolobus vulcani TaxID=38026 RepID=A0A7Z7AXP8_9EURY|nr:YhbY family RNA-binding protein [Methanolobus vulcani]MDK2824855.1 RNA-binding protein [Methanolobus sp.]MDK2948677.1 RNA-binding protein [Methanolobus sp.]SDF50298.1 RNA-binding protein [Methanolobus vulcani]